MSKNLLSSGRMLLLSRLWEDRSLKEETGKSRTSWLMNCSKMSIPQNIVIHVCAGAYMLWLL